jgi:hypothetical protein
MAKTIPPEYERSRFRITRPGALDEDVLDTLKLEVDNDERHGNETLVRFRVCGSCGRAIPKLETYGGQCTVCDTSLCTKCADLACDICGGICCRRHASITQTGPICNNHGLWESLKHILMKRRLP